MAWRGGGDDATAERDAGCGSVDRDEGAPAGPRWHRRLLPAALLGGGALLWLLYVPAGDEVTQICRANAMYRECGRTLHLAEDSKVKAYVDTCREVFPTLPESAKKHLLQAWKADRLVPLLEGNLEKEHKLAKLVHPQSIKTCAGNTRQKEPHEVDIEAYAMNLMGVRPLKERFISVSEIPEAFRIGETAKFDATKLLPKRVFNTSLEDIAAMHQDSADNIPTWIGMGLKATADGMSCWNWMNYYTDLFERYGSRDIRVIIGRKFVLPWVFWSKCPAMGSTTLDDLVKISKKGLHTELIPYKAFGGNWPAVWDTQKRIKEAGVENILGLSNLNMRHLRNFQVDVGKLLGMDDSVEATLSLVWFGTTAGEFHIDFQDNVLIQLTESCEIMIVPANCSHKDLPGGVMREWMQHWKVPFFHTTIHAGEGIIIPSMAPHKVVRRNSRTVAINAFLEPRFGKMRWGSSAPNNIFTRMYPGNAAMRVLWLRSMRRLWDEKRINLFMHTHRIDYI